MRLEDVVDLDHYPITDLDSARARAVVAAGRAALAGETPVLLTSPMIRPYVRSIIERFRGQTVVLSQNEVHSRAKLKTVGSV